MPFMVRYLTHPQVLIEPLKDIRSWSLNSVGAARIANLASRLGRLSRTRHVISSSETKAFETARPLANALGTQVDIREKTHEINRSSTGFLSEREFERVAADFFSQPDKSVQGWETASAAQQRIMSEVEACLKEQLDGDVLIVGHGGVGTLLFCGLSGLPIDRSFDQDPGGGFWFEFDSETRRPLRGWRPMEAF